MYENLSFPVLCVVQITRQGINYTADSFITIVQKALFLRIVPSGDPVVG